MTFFSDMVWVTSGFLITGAFVIGVVILLMYLAPICFSLAEWAIDKGNDRAQRIVRKLNNDDIGHKDDKPRNARHILKTFPRGN